MVSKGRSFLAAQMQRAAAMGHALDLVELVPDLKYRAVCSCGYSSTNRRTKALALGAGLHHAAGVVAESSRNGRPPATPGSPNLPPTGTGGL